LQQGPIKISSIKGKAKEINQLKTENKNILTINGGSSSIKAAVYKLQKDPERILSCQLERMGLGNPVLVFTDPENHQKKSLPVKASNMTEALDVLMKWLEEKKSFNDLAAIGHRIVHGMEHTNAELISELLLAELGNNIPYDPDHLPVEIALINAFRKKVPSLPQVACFDTAFHNTMPGIAKLLAIPRRFEREGIRRYGFHGLSFSYLMEELGRLDEPAVKNRKIILAHLGNGASLAAVRNGSCIDTSMGFTPSSGLMMGTRPGDLDPGIGSIIMKKESLTPDGYNALINHSCGLLGVSETSSDMQDLLGKESKDIRASEAVSLFCYQVKKWIGSYTAVLGGLDTIVFSGGIGENSATVRSRICEGLQFMGIELNEKQNESCAKVVSSEKSIVKVYVIPTDEELMIAKMVSRVLSI
jgi:acetate kinase